MAYGTIKVDNITFTSSGVDETITVSGIVQSVSGDLTVTGTVQGANIIGTSTVSGATVTGNIGSFTTITGGVVTLTSGVFASGVEATPSISIGTVSNGFYSPAENQVALSTNGTGKLFIDSAGKVGIGPNGTGGYDVVFNPGTSSFPLIRDSSGRLLVGTSSARSPLTHTPSIQVEGLGYATSTVSVISNSNDTNGAYLFLGKSRGTSLGSNTIVQSGDEIGGLDFIAADGTQLLRAARITALVDGTPAYAATALVSGQTYRIVTVGTTDFTLIGASANTVGTVFTATGPGTGTGTAILNAGNMPGRLVFSTTADGASSPTERMRITNEGKIGIGGTPSEELHIFAPSGIYEAAAIGFTARNATNSLLPFAKISVAHAGAGADTSNLSIVTTDASATQNIVATFYHDGSAALPFVYADTVGATNRDLYIDDTGKLGYVSSIRESKANIAVLSDVDWLYQLEPVSFNRRKRDEEENYIEETYSELEYGLIAEDAEIVNPELCFYDNVEGVQELRGVHYSKLIAPLLKAVQDLKTENDSLKARVTALETP